MSNVRITIRGKHKTGKTSLAKIIEHALKPFVEKVTIVEVQEEPEKPLHIRYSSVSNVNVIIDTEVGE